MDAGPNGLPGQHATEFVEQEIRQETEPVQTPAQSLGAETVGGKMSE